MSSLSNNDKRDLFIATTIILIIFGFLSSGVAEYDFMPGGIYIYETGVWAENNNDTICSDINKRTVLNTPIVSQFGQDSLLWYILHDQPGGIFVDLAAAWPIKLSNTYIIEKCLGWTGLCIDADREKVKLLESGTRNCRVISNCVSDKEQTMIFKSSVKTGTNSFSNNLVDNSTYELKCRVFDEIMYSENMPNRIDLLSLDVESYEPWVLLGNNEFKIDILIIELAGCRKAPESVKIIKRYLKQNHYVPVTSFPFDDAIQQYIQNGCVSIVNHSAIMIADMTVDDVFDHHWFNTSVGRWQTHDVLFIRRDSKYLKLFIDRLHCGKY